MKYVVILLLLRKKMKYMGNKKKTDEQLKKYLELNKKISNKLKGGKSSIVDIFQKMGEITEYIDTGSYIINAVLSGSIFGGIPNARSVEIAGPPQTGKSYLLMNIMRGAQARGYFVYYIDTEGSMEDADLLKFGINPEYAQIIKKLKTFNDVKFFINTIIDFKREDPTLKIFIGLDSFGMLNTEASLENARKGKYAEDMGKRAKEGRELFRTITLDLSNLQIPFVFTNHTGKNLDLFAQESDIPSGGDGPTYAASIILLLDRKIIKSDNDKKLYNTESGILVRLKTKKNRLAIPLEKYTVISFSHGMNPYIGLEQYVSWERCGVDRGIIYNEAQLKEKYKGKAPTNTTGKPLEYFEFEHDKNKFYFVRNQKSKSYGVMDSIQNIQLDTYYTPSLFTQGTLARIDEVVKSEFKYKDYEEQMMLQQVAMNIAESEKIKLIDR